MEVVVKPALEQKHFVLVHGACHGAWCWYKLATLLQQNGHLVTALDLKASGRRAEHVEDIANFTDYTQPLLDFLASNQSNTRKFVLVGHSYGGWNLVLAMATFPHKIELAVFFTAFMAKPSSILKVVEKERETRTSYVDSLFNFKDGQGRSPTSFLFGPEFMASQLYQNSTSEDITLGNMLIRAAPTLKDEDFDHLISQGDEKFQSVRRAYIICEEDKAITKQFQLWMIDESPPNEVREIEGSDHMAMMCMPHELLVHVLELTKSST